MLPYVKIKYLNGQLGTVAESADGLLALVVAGATAVSTTFELGKSYRIRRWEGLAELGVTAENNARLDELVRQFYSVAPEGTELVVVGYASTKTFTQLCDKSTGDLKTLLQTLRGELRGLVLAKDIDTESEPIEGLDPDVFSAAEKAQELGDWAADELYAPVFIALEGRDYQGAEELKDFSTASDNRVCIVIGDVKEGGKDAAMGLFAGRVASTPVQRNIGRVRDGAFTEMQMYIGDKAVEAAADDAATLHDKRYLTMRTYTGRTGVFWTDDNMLCDATDDYAQLANRRVIDKSARVAYLELINYMVDEIPVNDDGTMQTAMVKSWQAAVEGAVDASMTAAGELSPVDGSGCSCYIDPTQNVVSTSRIAMTLKVRPFAYARYIEVDLGFLVTAQ